MQSSFIFSSLLILTLHIFQYAQGLRILLSNDDGWAGLYIRRFYDQLTAGGHDVVLSAPAQDESGTGSSDVDPLPRTKPCQYYSCPPNSGSIGANKTNLNLNWVNSYPATSVRWGIDFIAPRFWGMIGATQFVVTGPNYGNNLGSFLNQSGTVGAAAYAAREAMIPSIAFSAADEGPIPWDRVPPPLRATVYGEVATLVTNTVLREGYPFLPDGVFFNVNMPSVNKGCQNVTAFKYVYTRVSMPENDPPDYTVCGGDYLPTEEKVLQTEGCYVAISPVNATNMRTALPDPQYYSYSAVRDILTCLPS